jgi:WD40 repeat protein
MNNRSIRIGNDETRNQFFSPGSKGGEVRRRKIRVPSFRACVTTGFFICLLIHSHSFALADNEPLWTFKFPGGGLSFDSSGRILIIVHDGIVESRNIESGRQVARLEKAGQHFNALAMDKQRSTAYCATIKGQICRLDLEKFQLSDPIAKGISRIYGMAVTSKGGGMLAFHDSTFDEQANEFTGSNLKLLDLRTNRFLYEETFHGLHPNLGFSADGKLLAYCDNDEKGIPRDEKVHVKKVDALGKAKEDVAALQGPRGISAFTFVANKQILAIVEWNDFLRLWDCTLKKEIARTSVATGGCIVSSDQGNLLIIGSSKHINILQSDPLKSIHRMKVFETTAVDNVAISADAKFLAVSGADYGDDDQPGHGQVKVWRLDKLLGK